MRFDIEGFVEREITYKRKKKEPQGCQRLGKSKYKSNGNQSFYINSWEFI